MPSAKPRSNAALVRAALARVRAVCLSFPQAEEKVSHGAPLFHVRGKAFVMFLDDHHGDGRTAVWCKAPPGAQGALVEADPRCFFVPPYVGPKGWVGVRLDQPSTSWSAVRALAEDGWRMIAPKRLLAMDGPARTDGATAPKTPKKKGRTGRAAGALVSPSRSMRG